MKDLILIGKQGSGKGTQAKILAKKFGFKIFETGSELRYIAAKNSELGRMVKEITTRGDLVSNEIVMKIVENFLQNSSKNVPIIFDGIPRSEEQRKSLEKLLENYEREFSVLEVQLSNDEALRRLTIRGTCNDCGTSFGGEACPKCGLLNICRRADDNPESILKRLENFKKYTVPLLEIWKKKNKVISTDGEQPVEMVATEILEKSPRAAAALLRLAIQKLCRQLGEKGKDLNEDIGELVKKGLPVKIQKALDIVRVIGNESVHPGQINLDDNNETAHRLFELINLIANTMITQPKEIDNIYNTLPKEKLKSITERDK